MMGREHVQGVLADYARLLGMRELALDEDGQCELAFGDGVHLALGLADEGRRLVMAAPLGTVPPSMQQEIQAEMLDANYLWQGTGGMTLAVERSSGTAMLCFATPTAGLGVEQLEADIDRLLGVAESWMSRLAGNAGHTTRM